MTRYSDLLDEGRIKRGRFSRRQVEDCLEIASRDLKTAVRFLSLEPLLGPLPTLKLDGIDWVIVGGESGPRARLIREEWVIDIRDQCIARGIPFFFKQRSGRHLEGKLWNQWPRDVTLTGGVTG